MTKVIFEEPDTLDQAMSKKAVAIKQPPKKRKPTIFQYLNKKGSITNEERLLIIRKYNEYFNPKVSEATRCGGTLKMMQRKLKRHLNI